MNKFNKSTSRKNINAIKWEYLKQFSTENILPFWVADSDYQTAPEIIKGLIERIKNGTFGYTSLGDDYYLVLKEWFKKRYDYKIEASYIVTSPGVVTALEFIVETFSTIGDKIIVEPPVYNPFYDVIKNNDRITSLNKLIKKNNKYLIDYNDLEKKLKTDAKIMFFCNPHNPVGRVWSYEEVEKVVNLCKKYDCLLVSDEIHCDLILGKNKFTSVGKFLDTYDKVIICTAPSKTFNLAGLQTSNIIIKNEELNQAFRSAFRKRSLEVPNLLGVEACKIAYRDCEYWLDEQLKHLNKNANLVYKFFKENISKAKVTKLEGTYLMWIDFSCLNKTSKEIVEDLTKYKVLVNSATLYSEDYDGFIRLNIACSLGQLQEGLNSIKEYYQSLMNK